MSLSSSFRHEGGSFAVTVNKRPERVPPGVFCLPTEVYTSPALVGGSDDVRICVQRRFPVDENERELFYRSLWIGVTGRNQRCLLRRYDKLSRPLAAI